MSDKRTVTVIRTYEVPADWSHEQIAQAIKDGRKVVRYEAVYEPGIVVP